jgi:hypothetical protein
MKINVFKKAGIRVTFERARLIFLGLILFCSSTEVARSELSKDSFYCQFSTSSGQIIDLAKICNDSDINTSSKGKPSMEMWDEKNHDPNFVKRGPGGSWMVRKGGARPFKFPDGAIAWTDGRITETDGVTTKLIEKNGNIVGVQFYRQDKVTPLKPGETMELPSGRLIEQRLIQEP